MTMSKAFHPPARLLLGPGPSNVEERVLQAMSAQVIGYFDPFMPEMTGEIHRLLNVVFGTENRATFPISSLLNMTDGLQPEKTQYIDVSIKELVRLAKTRLHTPKPKSAIVIATA